MKIVTDKTPKVDVASILTEVEIAEIHEFMHHYPQSRAASLDALKIVQRRNGWVDDAQVNAIANILKILSPMWKGWQRFITVSIGHPLVAM